MSNEMTWLRAHVRERLREIWSVCSIQTDEDGDVPFRSGAAAGWVMVVESEPVIVRVLLHAAYDVKPTAAVLREVNDVNFRARTAKVSITDGLVLVEQSLHAAAVTIETLQQALEAVCNVANDLGPMLVLVHGGRTPYPVEDVASESGPAG